MIPYVCPPSNRMFVLLHIGCLSTTCFSYTKYIWPPTCLSSYTDDVFPLHIFPPIHRMFVPHIFVLLQIGSLDPTCLSSYTQDVWPPNVCPPTQIIFVPHMFSSYIQYVCPPNFCPPKNRMFGSHTFNLLYTGCLSPMCFSS